MRNLNFRTVSILSNYGINVDALNRVGFIKKFFVRCYNAKEVFSIIKRFKNLIREKNNLITKLEDEVTDKIETITILKSQLNLTKSKNVEILEDRKRLKQVHDMCISNYNVLKAERQLVLDKVAIFEEKIRNKAELNRRLEKELSTIKNNVSACDKKQLADTATYILKINNKNIKLSKDIETLKQINIELKKELQYK